MTGRGVSESQGQIIVFGARQIRRAWVDGEWFFSAVDIVGALTDSANPRDYWYRTKRREKVTTGVELSTSCRQLALAGSSSVDSLDGSSKRDSSLNLTSQIVTSRFDSQIWGNNFD